MLNIILNIIIIILIILTFYIIFKYLLVDEKQKENIDPKIKFKNNFYNFDYKTVNYGDNELRVDLVDIPNNQKLQNIQNPYSDLKCCQEYNTETLINKYKDKQKEVEKGNYNKKQETIKYPDKRNYPSNFFDNKNKKIKQYNLIKNNNIPKPTEVNIDAKEVSGLNNITIENNQQFINSKSLPQIDYQDLDIKNKVQEAEDKYRNGTFITPNYNNFFIDPIKSLNDEKYKLKAKSNKIKDIYKSKVDTFKYQNLGQKVDFSIN